MKTYFVEVVDRDTKKVVKRIDCGDSERKSEKVKRAVNMQMSIPKYFTRIVSESRKKGKAK